jgi:hypothetical protein
VRKSCIALLLVVLATAGACSKNALPSADGSESIGLRGQQPCLTTPSPIAQPTFAAGFPSIGDVTWTADQPAGPSRVISGYTGDALEDLFNEMKDKFAQGGYAVTKSERDPHDAEVNFESKDNNGQVRLAEECQGRTSVVLTLRPAVASS